MAPAGCLTARAHEINLRRPALYQDRATAGLTIMHGQRDIHGVCMLLRTV